MSEKPPGLPPGQSNCDDANLQIIRNTHAQMKKFVATIGNTVMACESGPLTLRAESAMMVHATLIKPVGLTVASPVLGQPDLAVRSKDAQAPNGLLEFLLLFCASQHELARFGDINELFEPECARLGRARANWRYWAQALRILLSALARAAMKLAVIIAALTRYFG